MHTRTLIRNVKGSLLLAELMEYSGMSFQSISRMINKRNRLRGLGCCVCGRSFETFYAVNDVDGLFDGTNITTH